MAKTTKITIKISDQVLVGAKVTTPMGKDTTNASGKVQFELDDNYVNACLAAIEHDSFGGKIIYAAMSFKAGEDLEINIPYTPDEFTQANVGLHGLFAIKI